MKAYHFTGSTLLDGAPIPAAGEWLIHTGTIEPCRSGLHASQHPFDALKYAPGSLLHLVEIEGDIQEHGEPVDKVVGRRRKILATIDAGPLLCEFARWCALQVIDLWDAPQIVREYLASGEKSLRAPTLLAAEPLAKLEARAAWAAAFCAAKPEAIWAAERAATWAASAAKRSAEQIVERATLRATWATDRAVWETRMSVAANQRAKFQEMVDAAFAPITRQEPNPLS
jgi:hypothetical protein